MTDLLTNREIAEARCELAGCGYIGKWRIRLQRALATIEALQAQIDDERWRDIETEPPIYDPGRIDFEVWSPTFGPIRAYHDFNGLWYFRHGAPPYSVGDAIPDATHWRPLSKGPKDVRP